MNTYKTKDTYIQTRHRNKHSQQTYKTQLCFQNINKFRNIKNFKSFIKCSRTLGIRSKCYRCREQQFHKTKLLQN